MHRRTFILSGGSTLACTPLSASAIVNAVISDEVITSPVKLFTKTDWLSIAIVQNHLFPSEPDVPGAVEINALHYLHKYLSNPATDPLDSEFILLGSRLLQQSNESTLSLTDQSIEQREITLRQFEKTNDGRRWLVTILNYVLEALLTDPVYGGNPDGIGWQWLEHRAGEPRPPMNKRYWLL